jgi:hypothetical protein
MAGGIFSILGLNFQIGAAEYTSASSWVDWWLCLPAIPMLGPQSGILPAASNRSIHEYCPLRMNEAEAQLGPLKHPQLAIKHRAAEYS